MSNEIVAAERWLFSALSGSAALAAVVGTRIYGHKVPIGTTYPLAYFTMPAAADDFLTVEANRVWSTFVYAVRVIGKVESYVPLETGAAAIETALHKASGTNVSGVIYAAIKEAPFAMIETDRDGAELRHLGGLFRLYVQ